VRPRSSRPIGLCHSPRRIARNRVVHDLRDFGVTASARNVARRLAGAILRLRIGRMAHQQTNGRLVPAIGGAVQRTVAAQIGDIRIRTLRDESSRRLRIPGQRGPVQNRFAGVVAGIHVRAGGDQQFDEDRVRMQGRQVHRRFAMRRPRAHARPCLNQHLRQSGHPTLDRAMQRGLAVRIAGVDIDAFLDHQPFGVDALAFANGAKQRRFRRFGLRTLGPGRKRREHAEGNCENHGAHGARF